MSKSLNLMSLKTRSMLLALLALAVALPITYGVLTATYKTHSETQIENQLNIQCLMLLSEIELEGERLLLPNQLPISDFNLVNSGLYASVYDGQTQRWSSASSLFTQAPLLVTNNTVGEAKFSRHIIAEQAFFHYTFSAEFYNGTTFVPLSVVIMQSTQAFDIQYLNYRDTLILILMGLALLMFSILSASLLMALSPLSHLKRNIRALETHDIDTITTQYPAELNSVKVQINHLIEAEKHQRERYKNSLGDLAHSLKTPLAVLSTMDNLPTQASTVIQQLDKLIQRQLKRASTQINIAAIAKHPVAPIIEQLFTAMKKIYADKVLDFTLTGDKVALPMDTTDLMELVGNLIDNACKAANQSILITLTESKHCSHILIEDDGPGVPAALRQQLYSRGQRLDSYTDGQGIGLAVVWDLISAYNGELTIEDSQLGGAKFSLILPHS